MQGLKLRKIKGCTLATNFRQNVKTIRNLCNSEIDPKLYHIYWITFSSTSWTCSKFTTTKNFLIIIAKPKSFCNYISGNLEALLSMVLSMICVYLFVQCLHCSGTEGYWRDARRCPKTLLGTCVHYVQLPVISEERSSTQRCNSVYYQQAVVSVNRKKKKNKTKHYLYPKNFLHQPKGFCFLKESTHKWNLKLVKKQFKWNYQIIGTVILE